MKDQKLPGRGATAFLLAQIGAHAAHTFGARLKPLGFAPYHAGLLRIVAAHPGISQQQLAQALRMHASNLVQIVDELEERSLLERKPSQADRRQHSLHLTAKGKEVLSKIGEVAREHGQALLAGLSAAEQAELNRLLSLVAREQGLTPGVHPGYAKIGATPERSSRKPRFAQDPAD
jgi:DNA-binding MarR family transcriptional regulator